jgi:signal transduction histidine kinase/CHASE1-domain containing sensor protein/integral membrane sensor domain MASE1
MTRGHHALIWLSFAPMNVGNHGHIGSLLDPCSRIEIKPRRYEVLFFVLFLVVIFLSVRLGLSLTASQIAPIWPATGIGTAALLLFGRKYWPAIALAAYASSLIEGDSVAIVIGITVANTCESLIGSWLIQVLYKKQQKFSTHSASAAIVVGILAAAALSATIGISSLYFSGMLRLSEVGQGWTTWFSANFLGGILLVPFILSCFVRQPPEKTNEAGMLLFSIASIALGYFLFVRPEGTPYLFLIFPYVYWAVVLFSDRTAKLLIIALCFLAIASTRLGYGPFHYGNYHSNLLNLLILMWGISISSLIISDFKRMNTLRASSFIMLCGWFISGLVFFTCYSLEQHKVQASFENSVDDTLNDINLKLQSDLTALRSGAAYFSVSKIVERHEWRDFVRGLHLKESRTGMLGMGVIYRVPRSKLKDFIRQSRRDDAPEFDIRSVPGGTISSDKEAFIIAYVEPLEANKKAAGLDYTTELRRYNTAIQSAESGQLEVSQSVHLATVLNEDAAFLMFYPLYSPGPPPVTIEERRARSVGWITAPILTKYFFSNSIDEKSVHDLSYSVREPETGLTLAQSPDFHTLSDVFGVTRDLKIANRSYIMHFKPTVEFIGSSNITASWIGIAAALLTLLLSVFTAYIHLDKKRATLLVNERTQQLEMTGRMANLGGWEVDMTTMRVFWSVYTREIHAVAPDFKPDIYSALSFYKKGRSRDKISKALKLCMEKGIPFDLELEFINGKGQELWVRVIGQAHVDHGKIDRLFGAFQNITERLQLERENTFIIDSLKLGIWKYNPLTNYVYWDKNMFHLYEIQSEDFTYNYHAWESCLTEESKATALRDLELALTGEKLFDTTLEIRTKSGTRKFIGARGVVVKDEHGKATFMSGINWDKTSEVLLEQQLAEQRAKTLQASKLVSLGEMSAGIAHEINNPLAIIDASTELLLRLSKSPDRIIASAEIIKKASERINRIVSGLRRFARSSDKPTFSEHRVSEIIRESMPLVTAKSKRSNTDVICELKSESLVRCDNFEIEQVFINLMNNAIDAVKTQKEKWVKIENFDEDRYVVVRVSDSGPGISEEKKSKIFEPFFTTKEVGEGTGLGLSISKGILDDHKASISIRPDCPHTCFEIRFEKVDGPYATT